MGSELPLSIIIVNYNSGPMIVDCLESIKKHAAHIRHEVIVVDNASQDDSADLIEKHFPEVQLNRSDTNLGFGAANNRAARVAKGRFLLFLNNDAFLLEGSLDPMMESLQNDSTIGVIGPEIRYPDGRFQLSSGPDITLFNEFVMKHLSNWRQNRLRKGPLVQTVDWISGACMMIPADVFHQVNGFDETFFLYMEDADLCKRIRNSGYKIILNRTSTVIHCLGKTTSKTKSTLLPTIKRGHLHYYAQHNSAFSLLILRIYLYLRYRFDSSMTPETHKTLMETIRRKKLCRT